MKSGDGEASKICKKDEGKICDPYKKIARRGGKKLLTEMKKNGEERRQEKRQKEGRKRV